MRRRFFAFSLVLMLCSASVVSARQMLQADQCTIAANETVDGNLFVACRTLDILGTVTGDVIGAAATATISGTVQGSVYLVGGELNVLGTIGSDLHFAGPILQVQSGATLETGDLYSLSLSTIMDEPIPGSVVAVGYQLVLNDNVGREVSFWGSALNISGEVSGTVDASVGDPNSSGVAELRTLLSPSGVELISPGLTITDSGMVNGQLTYSAPVEGEIIPQLPLEPVYEPIIAQGDIAAITESQSLLHSLGDYIAQVLREIITLTAIGIVALVLLPSPLQAPIPTLRMRPLPSLGVGLLTFILSFPIFFIILALSVLLVLFLSLLQLPELTFVSSVSIAVIDFSSIGFFYFTAFMISRVIVALAIGRFIMRRLFDDDTSGRALILGLLLGVVILSLFASLPVVGWLVSAVAVFLGLGAILTLLQEQLQRTRTAPIAETPAGDEFIEAHSAPPPSMDDEPDDPTIENLPPGFKWWE